MKKVLIIILSALLVTGCVQVNGSIEIKKDTICKVQSY